MSAVRQQYLYGQNEVQTVILERDGQLFEMTRQQAEETCRQVLATLKAPEAYLGPQNILLPVRAQKDAGSHWVIMDRTHAIVAHCTQELDARTIEAALNTYDPNKPTVPPETPLSQQVDKIRGIYFAGQNIFRHNTIKILLDRIDELERGQSPTPLLQPVLTVVGFNNGQFRLVRPFIYILVAGGEDIRLDEGDKIRIEVEKRGA